METDKRWRERGGGGSNTKQLSRNALGEKGKQIAAAVVLKSA